MALNNYDFLTVRRAPINDDVDSPTEGKKLSPIEELMNGGGRPKRRQEKGNNSLSLQSPSTPALTLPNVPVDSSNDHSLNLFAPEKNEDTSDAGVSTHNSLSLGSSNSQLSFSAPQAEQKEDLTKLLEDTSGSSMVTMDRVHSGIGYLTFKLDGAGVFPRFSVFYENMGGDQRFLGGNSSENLGLTLKPSGELLMNLNYVRKIRRVGLIMQTPFRGIMRVSSDIFPGEKTFNIEAPESLFIAPAMIFVNFGKITVRQTYVSQNSLRAAAKCIGFHKIAWRDDATVIM